MMPSAKIANCSSAPPENRLISAGGLLEAEIDLLDVDVRRRDDRAEPEDCKDRQREEDLLA
jgi:hypothetical protein